MYRLYTLLAALPLAGLSLFGQTDTSSLGGPPIGADLPLKTRKAG
jgi:hypothetical protein